VNLDRLDLLRGAQLRRPLTAGERGELIDLMREARDEGVEVVRSAPVYSDVEPYWWTFDGSGGAEYVSGKDRRIAVQYADYEFTLEFDRPPVQFQGEVSDSGEVTIKGYDVLRSTSDMIPLEVLLHLAGRDALMLLEDRLGNHYNDA
jgi:hypothetical protein